MMAFLNKCVLVQFSSPSSAFHLDFKNYLMNKTGLVLGDEEYK